MATPLQALLPLSLQQAIPLWRDILGLYFSVVFRFAEVHPDLPHGQLLEDVTAQAAEKQVELELPRAFVESFNAEFAALSKKMMKELGEPHFPTILAASCAVRVLESIACFLCGGWGLLVGLLQFVVAPLSFTGSFIRFLTNGSDCALHYACSFIAALVLMAASSLPTIAMWRPTIIIDVYFLLAFFTIDFVLNILAYLFVSERFGIKRLLLHIAYGTFNTKTYFLVVLGCLMGFQLDLCLMLLAGVLTLVLRRTGVYKALLRLSGWPCFVVCFYVEHRIGHLPAVYQHAHKMHHFLHDTTAFDAHIYGSGMNEEFFWILAEVLPCLLAPSLCFPYFLNLETLHSSLTNKTAHTRTDKDSSLAWDEDNFHADHHTLHRANYGSALGVLLDFYFGTMGAKTKGAQGLAYTRCISPEDDSKILICISRCEGPCAVPTNEECSEEAPQESQEIERSSEERPITEEELFSKTSPASGVWIALNNKVYDVTTFHRIHPGGSQILLQHAGTDASSIFAEVGHSQKAKDMAAKRLIGRLVRPGAGHQLSSPLLES